MCENATENQEMPLSLEKIMSLADIQSVNTDIKRHVLPTKDIYAKQDAACKNGNWGRDASMDGTQVADVLPFVFDDEVKVVNVQDGRQHDFQGSVTVLFDYDGRRFTLSESFGSCDCCCEYSGVHEDLQQYVRDKLIPFAQLSTFQKEINS